MKQLKNAPAQSQTRQKDCSLKALQVRRIPVEHLIPDSRNARTHSDAQIAAVAASIGEFGSTNPILVRSDNTILAGHARLLAARKLGLSVVPIIELSSPSEAQCRAVALADNQLALAASWDEDMLRAELATLQEQHFDLDALGFSSAELARLLATREVTARMSAPDVVPPAPQAAVTQPGDLWLPGKHRLLCGDATHRG